MDRYAGLLIRLGHNDGRSYVVEPQFSEPGVNAEVDPESGTAAIDFEQLDSAPDEAYGALLTQALFADPKVRDVFVKARGIAESQHTALRVRLLIEVDAAPLHSLRWETLCDPRDATPATAGNGPPGAPPLTLDQGIIFSRYLRSADWRAVRTRPRSELRVLVMIANPVDIEQYAPGGRTLQALDVGHELAQVEAGLGPLHITALAQRGQATLDNLIRHLRAASDEDDKPFDVVYLVCHGALLLNQPRLYLESDTGETDNVDGTALVEEIRRLRTPPVLVVLASCQSGGGSEGAPVALGPRLAWAGVPAVLAMQGRVTISTAMTFMGRFFTELQKDGFVERAAAEARWAVKDAPDYWRPVLFSRLRSGSIWSLQDEGERERWAGWTGLVGSIQENRCTPILGPGMIEFVIGSSRDLARQWAHELRFPLSPHGQEDLPQVAHFLEVDQKNEELPRLKLRDYLRRDLLARYGRQLPPEMRQATLEDLITEIGRRRREGNVTDPFRVLANLPLSVYLSTNGDNLLYEALRAEETDPVAVALRKRYEIEAQEQPAQGPTSRRDPQLVLRRWKDDDEVDWPESVYASEPDYRPSRQRPLVYHCFGQIKTKGSVVLTEDNYFDCLIAGTSGPDPIPAAVTGSWTRNALLFLGFQVDDWGFRVLFRTIIKQEGWRRKTHPHVAVQIDPEEGRNLDPRRAYSYLMKYFQRQDFSIFWGSTEEFMKRLWEEWVRHELEERPL
jgi:hypothetical protein